MTDERGILEFARGAIDAALRDLSRHAQLGQPEIVVSQATLGSLQAATKKALFVLEEFDCQTNLTPRIQQHLRTILNVSDSWDQVQSLINTLEDRAVFSPDQPGWQTAYDFFSGRIQRYVTQLGKLHDRLIVERFDDQIDRLTVQHEAETPVSDTELSELARTKLGDAWGRVLAASELDDPSLTLIFELGVRLLDLRHRIALYRDVYDPEQDVHSLEPQIDDLRMHTLTVIQFALMQMRCTKWIEKARDPNALEVLRQLTEICRTQYDRTYSDLVSFLQSEPFLTLQANLGTAMDGRAEPK